MQTSTCGHIQSVPVESKSEEFRTPEENMADESQKDNLQEGLRLLSSFSCYSLPAPSASSTANQLFTAVTVQDSVDPWESTSWGLKHK